jgi:FkbM family methyltransferase
MAFDVGANIGNHALWFSEICHLKVYAFEPVEHQILLDNVNLNKAGSRIRVFKTALGADYGQASEKAKCTLQTGEGTIPVVPMDSIEIPNNEKLSLIKIDVEGMEIDVLQGGIQTIRAYKPVILTEEWERETTQGIMKLLTPLGYEKLRSFGGRGRAPVGCWVTK